MRARKAVITAAGRGTRMFPATRSIQKEMLPLVAADGLAKPTLQILAEECLDSGVEQICIVVERGGGASFREHFRPVTDDDRQVFAGKEWAMAQAQRLEEMAARIVYVEQPSPEGFGHAVFQARDFAGDEPFVLLLGDHVYTVPDGEKPCVAQLLDAGEATGGSVTSLRLEPESGVGVTGIAKGRALRPELSADAPGQRYELLALQEKPTLDEVKTLATEGLPPGTYLGHFGIHLFTPEIFACLETLIARDERVKGEFQLTSAQQLLRSRAAAGEARPYRGAHLLGTRWDIGMPDEYLKTLAAVGGREKIRTAA